jgi:hypothetical protein
LPRNTECQTAAVLTGTPHALGLFAKCQRDIRAALERIIEKAGEVDVTAAAVVAAV